MSLSVPRERPLVTLKLAVSLDGRIAAPTGHSQWITGEKARQVVQRLRAEHDGVAVGSGTALADNPRLNVRFDGFKGRQPARIVFDARLRTRPDMAMFDPGDGARRIVLTCTEPEPMLAARIQASGVELVTVESAAAAGAPGVDIAGALAALRARGVTRLFVEGGAALAASLVRADLVDWLEWFQAPVLIGADGLACVGELGLEQVSAAPRFRETRRFDVEGDLWRRFERAR